MVTFFRHKKTNTPQGIGVTVLPELGEMFEIPAITEHGPVTILFIMSIPNSDLDVFQGIRKAEEFTLKNENHYTEIFFLKFTSE
ncbi:hypothetical protein GCM10020331_094120 [Ectobacillus funiculus]